jgi:hypothetical protein
MQRKTRKEKMLTIANTYADKLKPKFGVPVLRPVVGESFDANNDLFLLNETTVVHRDGHITRGTRFSVTSDALIEYNKRHMSAESFNDFYGDDPTELGFGA